MENRFEKDPSSYVTPESTDAYVIKELDSLKARRDKVEKELEKINLAIDLYCNNPDIQKYLDIRNSLS